MADSEDHLLSHLYKIEHFFISLIFAVLIFTLQYPGQSDLLWLKLVEIFSWVFLALSGLLGLWATGAFLLNSEHQRIQGLAARNLYRTGLRNVFFVIGLVLLVTAKACYLLQRQ